MIIILIIAILLTFVVYDLINSWFIVPIKEELEFFKCRADTYEKAYYELKEKVIMMEKSLRSAPHFPRLKDIIQIPEKDVSDRKSKPRTKKKTTKKILEKYETNK